VIGLAATATLQAPTRAPLLGIRATGAEKLLQIGAVTNTIGFVLAGIQALLDVRAVISSASKYRQLRDIAEDAKSQGHDPDVVDAVVYAASQKFGKAIQRSISFVASALSVGVSIALLAAGGLAMLAAGPVGWGALGVIAAVGLGLVIGSLLFKVGRWLYKWWSGSLKQKRHGMAARLYTKGAIGSDPVAAAAITALGLVPADLKTAGLAARAAASGTSVGRMNVERSQIQVGGLQASARMLQEEITNHEIEARLLDERAARMTGADTQRRLRGLRQSLQAETKAAAESHREQARTKAERRREILGESEWKGLVHNTLGGASGQSERDVVRLIFAKLGR
jgi:hypothetical protein